MNCHKAVRLLWIDVAVVVVVVVALDQTCRLSLELVVEPLLTVLYFVLAQVLGGKGHVLAVVVEAGATAEDAVFRLLLLREEFIDLLMFFDQSHLLDALLFLYIFHRRYDLLVRERHRFSATPLVLRLG